MNKELLTQLKVLKATPRMMALAEKDVPKKEKYWNGRTRDFYERDSYMRCAVENEILQVAFFFTKYMRQEGRKPAYVLYVSKKNRQFITYDFLTSKWREAMLDNLDHFSSSNLWICKKDETIIKEYLKSTRDVYFALLNFQRDIREEQLKARHKRITDPWDKDLERIPNVPKDWEKWIDKVAIRQNYIFYQYKRGGAKNGYCTYCGKEVPITGKPRHNKQGRCPRCRHEIVFKSLGKAGRFSTDTFFAYLIQRCTDGFVIREWEAQRFYTKGKYDAPYVSFSEIRRTIYDQHLTPRSYYWGNFKQREYRWISGNPCSYYYYGDQNGRIYGRTLPQLKNKELRKTGLVEWINDKICTDPEKYLAVLNKIPQIEQLFKSGLQKLTEKCLHHPYATENYFVNPDAKSLIRALGLDAQSFRRLRESNGGDDYLEWLQYEKRTGKIIPDELISWFCSEEISSKDIAFITDRMSLLQIRNYIQKQKSSFRKNSHTVLDTWADYLSMAKRLHMDTSDEIIYRAKKLRKRHDELVKICADNEFELQVEEFEEKFPHVNSICREIKEKYEYAGKDYRIVAPSGVADIVREGRFLHHCAAGSDRYWDRIEQKESFILFLRRESKPDQPFYTLEIEPDGTIRQKRTEYDRQKKDIESAKEFLKQWQKEVASRLKAEDLQLTAVSRALREQEFKQLREDQVVIHTGDLSGKLLVDVLMEDLLENTESETPELPNAA